MANDCSILAARTPWTVCLLWILHISGIMQHLSFCVWFISFNVFKFHPCCSMRQNFFRAEYYCIVSNATFCLSIHLSKDTWIVSTFWLLQLMLLEHWYIHLCIFVCLFVCFYFSLGLVFSSFEPKFSTWEIWHKNPDFQHLLKIRSSANTWPKIIHSDS